MHENDLDSERGSGLALGLDRLLMAREALGQRSELVESVEVLTETPYDALPPAAVERIGISPGHKNSLLRVVLRDLGRALIDEEANGLRNEIYAAVHEGAAWHWATRSGRII